ncbi:prenyltransferase [Limosilactobacillus fastidiosus]|uniref:Prenyltransferase n=1 Tax=Limosilactobacillus fastidiosus TaxID=2759855 RepID=A0A7W3YBU6_9LACO|nr:prenyltransferase [Limosilactobacillus fastidiosus]MBB1062534.1 prenyltransferase [Limosilactobacillus fastidiosus]MBB1085515.1 prenyltransferase [Limosilactobacillus fastidiosus]MCD7083608.1 prenyltransferase [Limosilactobacillus fastidiosus]MCD7085968.1 prenyltransferase [Limosilactobacillus fastidiosus]MCD7114388.1 prenyltransferase [Limosilactobacillus fastidiosus]
MDIPNHRQQFAALVQAQTTVISALPYLLGCAFTYFYYRHFNLGDTILLFIAVISFHLAVNGHNQYTDYQRFTSSGSVSENNIIAKFKIALPWARLIIGSLVLISAIIGIYLTIKAGWPLLLIGILSFIIGYAYSGGHHPILKTPLGEPASGITMGYNITLLAIYINIYNSPHFDPFFWLTGLLVSLPAILVISNVMLGNNICDRKEDVQIGKRTLVYYIGRPAAMKVLVSCYALSYIAIIAAVILRLLPVFTLLSLLTIPLVYRRIKVFVNRPDKMTTFFNILISLQLILISEIIFTVIGIFFNI